MANIDAPKGLQVADGLAKRVTRYRITASYATALYIGDPVVKVAGGTVEIATGVMCGAIVGFEEKGGKPACYYPASDSGTWYALVADHPDQEFIAQEDGDTDDLALADRGANVNLASGTGNTTSGISGYEIDSDSHAASATLQLHIIDLVDRPDNALGDNADWRVRINYHQLDANVVGI